MSINSFHLDHLRRGIKPFKLHWFPRLRSTNDHAAELRRRGELYAPAIVLTGRQIAGRGRGSNSWWSPARGGTITVTFVFPVEEHLSPHQVPLLAGLAVRDAAAELLGDEKVTLKWPNDVLIEGKKLAGLLCERVSKADLIGVGLNVNNDPKKAPAVLRKQITSLASIAGRPIDLNEALIALAAHLHRAMSRRGDRLFVETLNRYDEHHALVGRKVSVVEAGSGRLLSGKCTGLDSSGRLILRNGKKIQAITAGQVRMH
ncbi:MAG: BirA family transcriptional regulator [Phycisphaerales bacterium]|jgi:BirA family biotin operon repressor/biotin-[acetyl-CoA-carboxylase] ligase|nr:BirA family transcriptional regulator [Phycisphaerales bacterium]